ncbi:MAG: AraC family transcriptional regulator [Betaproteobacteria bacterium]|nr:AraC family transcriptional regulator [Betaproteobacteria bacterium]
MGFVTGMLSGLRAKGIDPSGMLQATGIGTEALSEPNARVPIDNYAALYNTVVRSLDDEGFALFSAPLRPGTFEFLCRSIVSSRTLEEALERASRFLRLLLPELRVTVSRGSSSAKIEIAETRPLRARRDDPCRVFAFEWLLRLLHGLSCWLVGRGLALNSVAFPYPKPAHAADYRLIYTEHSSFESRSLAASLTPNLLDLPVRRDEDALSAFLQGAPGKITMLYRRDRETVRQVRDIVVAALPQAVTLAAVADALHLSGRTLHRRLREEGSSFRAVKDAVRRDSALAKLEKTQMPVAQIATDLGYSEPSAFFRAFQGWTGLGPAQYRKRLARVPRILKVRR